MTPARPLLFLLGLALIVFLVSRLPDDVFRTTQAMLLLAAGALLLLVAAGAFLTPARRLSGRLFGYDAPDGETVRVAREPEWRGLMRPLFAALVCVAVSGVGALLR